MRDSTKKWLLAAAGLIVTGCSTFTVTAAAVGWDFNKFSTVTLETTTHDIEETFQNISINTKATNITFRPSDSAQSKIVCHEDVKQKSAVTVENGTLTIQSVDERAWYDYLTLTGNNEPTITVYLPQTQYANLSIETTTGDVKIPNNFLFNSVNISGSTCDVECSASVINDLTVNISTGDITLEEVTASSISLTVSTGDIDLNKVAIANDLTVQASTGKTELSHVTSKNYTHNSGTGDVEMENVFISGKMQIKTSTGDVEFDHCDAGEIDVETSTGDVEGSLLSPKAFEVESDTGEENTPPSSNGGKCKIRCTTGDIRITIVS